MNWQLQSVATGCAPRRCLSGEKSVWALSIYALSLPAIGFALRKRGQECRLTSSMLRLARVAEADQLLGDVMGTRGYPVADFETRAADISVDHPVVTQNYRTAHDIALRHVRGTGPPPKTLRRAMLHYRALFEELVGQPTASTLRAAATATENDYGTSASYKLR